MPGRLVLHALWIATALRLLLPSAADPDLWGHLLFGSLLLQGTLPAVNGFAYTAADHPWINHEILAEVAMAAVWNVGGAPGLIALKVVVGLATLWIVWRTAERRSGDPTAACLATILAAAVMLPGFMIRPQLFTLLFLAATLAVLARADYRPRGRVWLLLPLAVVWTNTHGGVLAGVGLAGAGMAAGLAARLWRGAADARDVGATALFVALLGSTLVANPYGLELVRFLVLDVTPGVPITEWAPVALGDLSFPLFKLLLVAVAVGVLRGAAVRPAEAAVVALTAGAALLHRRHIPLFAIAAAPLLAALLAEALRVAASRVPLRALRVGLAGAAALQIALATVAGVQARGRIVVDPWTYPVQALRFLAQNGIGGNVALPFRWGEYALWSLPPGSRVAVDGRFTTAYPEALLATVWEFMRGGPEWEALLTDYPTDVVVADRRQAPAHLLRSHAEWQYVYSDPVSVIFLRRVPSQAATLARFDAGALHYERGPLEVDFPGVHALPEGAIPAPSRDCRLAARPCRARDAAC